VTSVRPRQLLHRGTVEAIGLAFDEEWLGAREARWRILQRWQPGARVVRTGDQLLLLWSRARRVHSTGSGGAPVVVCGAALTTTALDPTELRALSLAQETFVRARGGAVEATPLQGCPIEDPSQWLDTSDWTLTAADSLGDAPSARVHDAPVVGDARAVLRDIPPAAPERDALLALLHRDAKARGSGRLGPARRRILQALAVLAAWLHASPPSSGRSGATSKAVSPPSAMRRAGAWLSRVAGRLLTALRLASFVSTRQGRYLRRMLAFFEEGDLDAALRHAIPIDGRLDDPGALGPALTMPSPRGDLAIRLVEARASRLLGVGPELQALLRQTYRRAHERLAAAGRVSEAAFVLTELLHANEEAVAFLEAHGEPRLAAELAEARGLPPGLVVRQWFVAGDAARAVAVARRLGAFADAVDRLERARSPLAPALRLLWAETLASAGAYGSAVDVVWPVDDARHLARAWIARAIEGGGPEGARMVVRLASIDPDAGALVREKALEVLNDHHPAASATRGTLAGAIVDANAAVPVLQALARAAVRSLLAAPLQSRDQTRKLIERLLWTADDGALRADVPPLEDTGPLPLVVRSVALRISLPARGAMAVHAVAAAPLPDGRTLVALGERGARLLSRDGRTIAHFDEPAHALVVSDRGDRAILMAPRGRDAHRLARVDLARRRSQVWCDARLVSWAPDFDGSTWVVGDDRGYVLVDALADEWSALTRVDLVDEERPAWISRTGGSVGAVMASWGIEALRFDLPGLVLRERRAIKLGEHAIGLGGAVSPGGRVALLVLQGFGQSPAEMRCTLRVLDRERVVLEAPWPGPSSASSPSSTLTMTDPWLATLKPASEPDHGIEVALIDTSEYRERLRLILRGATRASMSFGLDQLCVADDQGWIVTVDLQTGESRVLLEMNP
jgi:hypothetical protein